MTLRERLEKLEPRERRLLTAFGGVVGVILFLLTPIGLYSVVASKRSDNDEIRSLVDSIYAARATVSERKGKHDALLARYARPAPQLAGFIEESAKANNIGAAESADRPEVPHGKRYSERVTVVKMHKVGMLNLAKTLERIEQSGYPVAITKLNIKPRTGEQDSYEVELGVSAFDRKPDAPTAAATAAPTASASAEKEP